MLSCDSCLQPDTRNSCGISGNVFEDPPAPNEPPAVFFGNSRSLASAPCEPVSLNTGRLADRANELDRKTQKIATLTTRFARKFPTWNPPSHAEGAYLQNCMVDQPRNQVSQMHSDKFPNPSTCQCWETSFKTEVCSCSNFPTDVMLWIKEVAVDDLETSRSIGVQRIQTFELQDAKIASALKKVITNPYLKKKSQFGGAKGTNARPISPWKTDCVYDLRIRFRVTGAHDAVLHYTDLFSITLHGDDIKDFESRWDQALLSTCEIPNDKILERRGSTPNSIGHVQTRNHWNQEISIQK